MEAFRHILPRWSAAVSTPPPAAVPPSAYHRWRPPAASTSAPARSQQQPSQWLQRGAGRREAAQPVSAPAKPMKHQGKQRPWDGQPGVLGSCSSGDGDRITPSPGGGPGGESFVSVLFCSATGSPARGTQNLKKRAVSFLSGSQDGEDGSARGAVSTLPSHSPFASGQQGPVREHASRAPCPTVEPGKCRTVHSDHTLPSGSGPCVPLHCPTAGASVVPLVQLVQSLGTWLALPDRLASSREPSDSAMQFSSPGTLLSPGAFGSPLCWTRMLRSCVAVLLAKDAIQPVPPAKMRAGFYSPYFIVPKKGGGLRPILDLCVLNQALHKLSFRMLTQKRIF